MYFLETAKQELDLSASSSSACNVTSSWAEIYIRRPSGNTAWMMRIENPLQFGCNSCNPADVMHVKMFLKDVEAECEGVYNLKNIVNESALSLNLTPPPNDSNQSNQLTPEESNSRPSSLPSMGYMDLLSGKIYD